MITTGTLIRKTEPHQKWASSVPPVTGPTPRPRADTPAQMPIALRRSSLSRKTFVRIDSVEGMMNAPPMPMSARVKMSMVALVANADRADARPNTTRPNVSARYRPNLSPMLPAVSRRPAKTIV